MKKLSLIILFLLTASFGFAQDKMSDEEHLRRIADGIIIDNNRGFVNDSTGEIYENVSKLEDGLPLSILSKYSTFRYPQGVINIAMLDLGITLGDEKYIDYATKNIEFIYDNAYYFENILSVEKDNHWYLPFACLFKINYLDNCGAMAASIIDAYLLNNDKEYLDYIKETADFITNKQFRLEDGTLVRDSPVKYSLWADDLYMSVPFLARMGHLTGDSKYFDDAAKQIIQFTDYLWDDNTNLYFHSWHSDEEETSVAHWGRANGWIMMAQVELLKLLPKDHPKREELLEIFKQQIRGVTRYQSKSGLWHQLLDKTDSYLETSATAMFTYGIAYAVNGGIIPERYISVAKNGWKGILSKTDMDYQSSAVNGICIGTGIQSDLKHYYTRPTRPNSVGYGAVISAGVEIIKYNRKKHQQY